MLKQNKELLDLVLANIDYGVVVSDANSIILQVNHAFEGMTGYSNGHLLGKEIDILYAKQNTSDVIDSLKDSLEKKDFWEGEMSLFCTKAKTCLFYVAIYVQKDKNSVITNYVLIMRDSESKLVVEDTESVSDQHDSLTGLPNSYLFKDRAEQSIIAAKRVDKSVALLICGLDRFSLINDGLGHDFGSLLLKEVSARFKNCIRGSDTLARIQGDRFGMVLQIASVDDGVIVAEKILKAMKDPFLIRGQEVSASVSIGISLFPTDGDSAEELGSYAESAMHHVKKRGGNHFLFFANNMNIRAKERIAIENDLRRALQCNEFLLYYQPKVNAQTQKIIGMEALIRWNDPEKGIISPGVFIPVAEETGIIEPIGLWGLREACRQNKEWQDKGLQHVRVSVNVSAHQFRDADFVDYVKVALKDSGLNSKYLELELTESLFMDDINETINKLQQIRDLGCHLSIDDFGTGYSSLSYLTRFPITVLKIDKTFVQDVEANHSTAEIARAIIGLSQGLNLEVVAEGAETLEHVNFLRKHGCTTVQGFFFSRPLPPAEFETLLTIGFIDKD